MSTLLVTAQCWAEGVRGGMRREWRRILLGVALGWVLSTLIGALVLALADPWLSLGASNMLGAVFVWSSMALGGVLGYASSSSSRPRPA